jgi:beta-N-acetylhexosaminidase
MTNKNNAIDVLGELFIMGFKGLELEPETSEFLTRSNIGGVILFAHNYELPAQVAELTNQIQECTRGLPLWVSVDHEGGKVQRFRKGFTRIPEAAAIGATGSPKLAFEISELMANELHAVGINLNFSPIGDIATNPKNPIIGNRAFGTTADQVAKFCSAVVRGHLAGKVQPCVKHFPGHGDTSTDSHLTLPSVDTPLETLKEREFLPFLKAFKSGCSFVMSAHVLVKSVDPEVPATLSSKILKDILRTQLRYEGIIISDDLEMNAITDHYGASEAPRLALEAGCDLLIYRSESAARHGYESLVKALESGKLEPEIVLEAAERSRELKKKTLLPYHAVNIAGLGQKLATVDHQVLVEKVAAKRTL